jgi:hypothetical protein
MNINDKKDFVSVYVLQKAHLWLEVKLRDEHQ